MDMLAICVTVYRCIDILSSTDNLIYNSLIGGINMA